MLNFGKTVPRDIKIIPTDNLGFIVKTGCATLCFTTGEELCTAIREYVDDPTAVEEMYNFRSARVEQAPNQPRPGWGEITPEVEEAPPQQPPERR